MTEVEHVETGDVLTIHVWEHHQPLVPRVIVSVQTAPMYHYLIHAEASLPSIDSVCALADDALRAWQQGGVIGLASYLESQPRYWRHNGMND